MQRPAGGRNPLSEPSSLPAFSKVIVCIVQHLWPAREGDTQRQDENSVVLREGDRSAHMDTWSDASSRVHSLTVFTQSFSRAANTAWRFLQLAAITVRREKLEFPMRLHRMGAALPHVPIGVQSTHQSPHARLKTRASGPAISPFEVRPWRHRIRRGGDQHAELPQPAAPHYPPALYSTTRSRRRATQPDKSPFPHPFLSSSLSLHSTVLTFSGVRRSSGGEPSTWSERVWRSAPREG